MVHHGHNLALSSSHHPSDHIPRHPRPQRMTHRMPPSPAANRIMIGILTLKPAQQRLYRIHMPHPASLRLPCENSEMNLQVILRYNRFVGR